MTRSPIVIVGGFISWPSRYREMAKTLGELSGAEVYVAALTPPDWLAGLVRGYGQLVFEVATTVDRALIESESKEVVLVGHSVGGVASRVYMGGDPPFGGRRYSGHRRVETLITLGSPHLVREAWPLSPIVRANDLFPGTLHDEKIPYLSVAGTSVAGADSAKSRRLYSFLSGEGDARGDGVVPARSALLPGSEQLVFDDVRHDSHGGKWYGTREVVERWWPEELRVERHVERHGRG